METYLENFDKIFTTEITLHKTIRDEDIRVLYVDGWNTLFIIDINDVSNPNDTNLRFSEVPKTFYGNRHIKFMSWSIDSIVYPYVGYVSTEDMASERLKAVKTTNMFYTRKFECKNASFITLLENVNGKFCVTIYCNIKIIQRILEGRREPKYNTFLQLGLSQLQQDLLTSCGKALDKLLFPRKLHVEREFLDHVVIDCLKPDFTIYEHQIQDVCFMKKIEDNIDNGENTITYTIEEALPIGDGKLMLYGNALMKSFQTGYSEKRITYYGGNIISEIGLGKTLTVLYHIISSGKEDEPVEFLQYEPTCNYMFKRSFQKGCFCKKQTWNSTFFCKEHQKSHFIEKLATSYRNLENFTWKEHVYTFEGGSVKIKTNATLIICPNHLCDQWVKEYYDKFKMKKRVILVTTKDQYLSLSLGDVTFADIVIVSYSFLVNNVYCRINQFPDHIYGTSENIRESLSMTNISFNWFVWKRIVLDEAHEIYNRQNSFYITHVIGELMSVYKWNVTGTPFPNGLESFLSLVSLNTDFNMPYSLDYFTVSHIQEKGINSAMINATKHLFKRNTKQSVAQDIPETSITETIKLLEFTSQERNIYNSYASNNVNEKHIEFLIKLCCHCELNRDTRTLIQNCKSLDEIQSTLIGYNKNKLDDLKRSITSLELQLQRTEVGETSIASYKTQLTLKKKEYENLDRVHQYMINALQTINVSDSCPICLDEIDKVTITKCGHKFCWDCISHTFKAKQHFEIKCPSCNQLVNVSDVYTLQTSGADSDTSDDMLTALVNDTKSTKIGNIIHFIKGLDTSDKVILFSQWDELLHKVGDILNQYGIDIVYCNGTVFQKKNAIHRFINDTKCNVLLLSSRNAASGMNLTIANKIILLEPVYGSEEYRKDIESQAIGRANRIGQSRPIDVFKFVIKDSIEEDIVNNIVNHKINFST
jgi:SNF2 family DNA or RNA helicase